MDAHKFVQEDPMSTEEEEDKKELDCEENKALYHHEYRKELLAQAAKAVGATYDYEPSCGSTLLDVTAVHDDQMSWGEEIKRRPVELHLFHPPTEENVLKKTLGNMKYNDRLLLDFRGKPLRDFPNLPLVIFSMVEGWRVEAWTRSDSRMSMTDIVARMPIKRAIDPAGHQTSMPIYNSGTVRERARRFRNNAGLITWNTHGKDLKIESFMDELRSPAEKANNETIGRNLTDLEKASMGKLNVGTRPDRAQVRQDPEAKKRYLDMVQKKADLTFDFDCRAELPKTPEEIRDIQDALQQTYSDFAFYTNVPLEKPRIEDSYLDQWNYMQVQLNRIWANDTAKKTAPPQLFALGKWTVSFDSWVSAPQAYLTYVQTGGWRNGQNRDREACRGC